MSSNRFAGRRVLVTGASRGIGAATAERLAAEGADVAVTARSLDPHPTLPGNLRETARRIERHGRRAVMVRADLADENDRARIVPEAAAGLGGPVEVLVNNAAAAIFQPLSDFPLRRRRLLFEVNVHAPLDLAQAVLPGMKAAGEGWIVNLSSGTTRTRGEPPFTDATPPEHGVYGASKAALDRLTHALAVEVWERGVRVNAVQPRAAVLSEGADGLVGDRLTAAQIEPMEAMVEAIVALCDCPLERSGGALVSLDLIERLGLTVHALDGTVPAP